MTGDSSDLGLADAFTEAYESAQEAGEARYRLGEEGVTALENIAGSLDCLKDINRGLVDSQTSIHEKLNDMDSGSDVDEDYILSGVEDLLDEKMSGTNPEASSGFSTWSNYNFGTQAVEGMSTWSNYNFGTQVQSSSSNSSINTPTADVESDGWEIEAIEGELNDDFFDEYAGEASGTSSHSAPSIYNPQIKFSPEINIDGDEWTPDLLS